MIVLLTLFACASLSLALNVVQLPTSHEEHVEVFDKLIAAHGRDYSKDSDEYIQRLQIMKKNVQRIHETRKNDPGATYGLNKFFDLSEEEFQVRYKMPPLNIDAERKRQNVPVAASCLGGGATKRSIPSKQKFGAFPKKFDWRTHKPAVLTPVKNQGQCGSCWAFSTMETLESIWALKKGQLVELAPQQLVDCSHSCSMTGGQKVCNQGCAGGWPWAATEYLITVGGAELEKDYPYIGVDGTCRFDHSKVAAVPKNYTCVSGPHTATPEEIMAAAQIQPLSIAINAGSWQFYMFGVSDPFFCDKKSLDHAVQIVGWGHEIDLLGEEIEYWIIRNSWSASWGLDGFIKVKKGSNTCGVGNAVMRIEV